MSKNRTLINHDGPLIEKKNSINKSEDGGYISNESYNSSEFVFNFKNNITDCFEEKNKGLFKLSFDKKCYESDNIDDNIMDDMHNKTYSKNYKNKDIDKPDFVKDGKKQLSGEKDEIINNLKRHIIYVTNKFEKKLNNLENIQKDNFQLEQIYKNKYYLDMKKEKMKNVQIMFENDELLKKVHYYDELLQKLKQKIRCIFKDMYALIGCFEISENINFMLNNMKDISLLIESMKHIKFEHNEYNRDKEAKLLINNFDDIKDEYREKEENHSIKQSYRSVNTSNKNKNYNSNYETKKKGKRQNNCVNKDVCLRSDSFLRCENSQSKKINIVDSVNHYKKPIKYKYSIKRKGNNTNLKSGHINNAINAKKKDKISNFTIELKNVPLENSDNILSLLRKTRTFNYLLRNSFKHGIEKDIS
ncbi:conserved Plasmodium protein, unknown function [Plasmodium vinckei vinckei]|uniref:Uncharacterized protein n=1 Tax=Plasmodium vinckei vinckei TaxID=54757 RepID=A0A449BRU4_PLAVN|nr:conserved Plasmodium protein, unknown function [Plasmodium vinckei vinckei]VEV56132.1 conserved Plasmodium protein, unknown function [Plasmodium vinckei vinckei]